MPQCSGQPVPSRDCGFGAQSYAIKFKLENLRRKIIGIVRLMRHSKPHMTNKSRSKELNKIKNTKNFDGHNTVLRLITYIISIFAVAKSRRRPPSFLLIFIFSL